MKQTGWYFRQLLPLRYESRYTTEDGARHHVAWKMWRGRVYAIRAICILLAVALLLPSCITGTNQPDWDKIIATNQQTVAVSEKALTLTLDLQTPITARIGEEKYFLLLSGCYWGWLTARESLSVILTGQDRMDEMPIKNDLLAERAQAVLHMRENTAPVAPVAIP